MTARRGLMTVMELARSLADPVPPVVVDLRKDQHDGAAAIPGSVWADLHDGFAMRRAGRDLAYDVPTPNEVADLLGRLGVTPVSRVVFCDDMGNRWATRAYWILSYYGHQGNIAVLDGGSRAWAEAGLPTVDGFIPPRASTYPAPFESNEDIRATSAQVLEGVATGTVTVCDVRTEDEFTGVVALAARGGRIPGALHRPWDACLTPEGKIRPDAELTELLAPFLAGPGQPVTYCQGGIRASFTWFCLNELLGRPSRLYAGSWEEWGQDPQLPIQAGPATL